VLKDVLLLLELGAALDVRAPAPGMLFFTSDFSENGMLVVKRHGNGPDTHVTSGDVKHGDSKSSS